MTKSEPTVTPRRPIDVACDDPACGAQPGQACNPFCTIFGEPILSTRRGDMRAIRPGWYAQRDCAGCGGRGDDLAQEETEDCTCVRDSAQVLEWRAADLYRLAARHDHAEALEKLGFARRCYAHAIAAELRRDGCPASVIQAEPGTYEVLAWTLPGLVAVRADQASDHSRVSVRDCVGRVTHHVWHRGARAIAYSIQHEVPAPATGLTSGNE